MIESDNQSESMQSRFEEFQALDVKKDSITRKNLIRSLQALVRSGKVTISSNQISKYRASNFELSRILVYLLIEDGKVNSDPGMWQDNIRSEWELLNRSRLAEDSSRMPLYYAFRAYLSRLRDTPDITSTARVDRFFMKEVVEGLTRTSTDHDSQVLSRAKELLSLLESGNAGSSAKWSDLKKWVMGIVSAAVIAALGWAGNFVFTRTATPTSVHISACDDYKVTINQKSQKVVGLKEPVVVSGEVGKLPSNHHIWIAATLPVGSREFFPRDEVFSNDGKWETRLNPKLKHAKDVKRFAVFIVSEQGQKRIASHFSSMAKADARIWQPMNQDTFEDGEIVRCHGIHMVSVK